jgi:hypothetical protein
MDTESNNKTRSNGRLQDEKNSPARSNRLNLMMMRERGKIHRFELSFRLFIGVLLGLVTYLIVSGVVIHQYFDERSKNRIQSEELKRLKDEIGITKKENYRVRQRLAFLEDYAYRKDTTDQQQENPAEPEKPSPPKETKVISKAHAETITEQVNKARVAVNDLVIERKSDRLTVRFKLLNIDWGKTTASGYVHVIAKDSQSEPIKVWTFPKVRVENGVPIDYKKGQRFSIKRFITMDAKYFMEETDSPSSVQVLIYDEAGNVIFDQDYEVGNAS